MAEDVGGRDAGEGCGKAESRGDEGGPEGVELSVVVPMHDSARYLDDLIDILLDQGFPLVAPAVSASGPCPEPAEASPSGAPSGEGPAPSGRCRYEVIFVDDASADESARIVARAAALHPEVRLIRRERNGGAGAARNAGMDAARGEYLYFVDSDDWVERGCLRGLCERMESEGLDMLQFSGDVLYQDEAARELNPIDPAYLTRTQAPGVRSGRELLIQQVNEVKFCVQPCVLMTRTSFVRAHADIRFPEGIINEDNVFVMAAIIHAARVDVDPAVYYHHRVYASSVTSRSDHGLARHDSHAHISDVTRGYAYAAHERGDSELERVLCGLDYYFTQVATDALCEASPDLARSFELTYPTFTALVNERSFYLPLCEGRHRIEGLEGEGARLRGEVGRLQGELADSSARCEELGGRIDEVYRSHTWRAGRALVWLPGKVKALVCRLRARRG